VNENWFRVMTDLSVSAASKCTCLVSKVFMAEESKGILQNKFEAAYPKDCHQYSHGRVELILSTL
jgi:hypothetical protein